MQGYECWFCGQTIDPADVGAVLVGIVNLWTPMMMVRARKSLLTHAAQDHLKGASMEIDPRVFRQDG